MDRRFIGAGLDAMNGNAHETLLDLVTKRRTAALGTLHSGEPSISMVPFALLGDGSALIIHVSRLSSHTADMLASPRVSVMIAAAEAPEVAPQALPRAIIRGDAVQVTGRDAEAARQAYLSRFPEAEAIFALPDFSLFAIRPLSARVIAGFGSATTLSREEFVAAVLGEAQVRTGRG